MDVQALARWKAALLAAGLSPLTARGYATGARTWLRWRGAASGAPQLADLQAWLDWMRAAGFDPTTVRCYLHGVESWLEWSGVAVFRGGLRLPPQVEDRRVLIAPAEVLSLLYTGSLGRHWPVGAARAMVALAAGSGLRSAELRALHAADLDLGGLRVYVRKGKRGWSGSLPIPEGLAEVHRSWLVARAALAPASPRYLVSSYGGPWGKGAVDRVMRLLLGAAGIVRPGLTVHALRHAAITAWAEAGNLRDAQELARHKRIATTARYVHPTDRRLREISDAAAGGWLSGTPLISDSAPCASTPPAAGVADRLAFLEL